MSFGVQVGAWTSQIIDGTYVGICSCSFDWYQQMPLTDSAVRNARPSLEGKDIKLSDGGGLHLLIKPAGQKYWRLNYRYLGKQKTLALGVYPLVTLKDAREARDSAKKILFEGVDPSVHRQNSRAVSKEAAANSFEGVALEWMNVQQVKWSPSYAVKIQSCFDRDIFPYIGRRPVSEVTAPELLIVLRRIVARGAAETAKRARQCLGQVFRYAIATGRAERDPAADLKGALPPVRHQSFANISEPRRIGEVLRMFDSYQGSPVVCAALKLAPMLFVRPGNLRQAEWSEVDLDAATWRIPAEKMKMRQPHIVPLPTQAVELLRELKQLTGRRLDLQPYVFPSARAGGRPMSDNALLVAMRTMGIPKEELTAHGFRHMASTLLHEQGWDTDWIEVQLAHGDHSTRGKYNFAKYLKERTRMMQSWADYLDALRRGAEIIPINQRA
ncbi:tyrosine-type recombinase/integrase [Perlucidibaca piscinae]|uniref:tyrosine-type recombinase/integrase n=1 Tax=Perlucidibaca piscinae TaxID=392589 RepID=UPI001B7F9D75|nr:integrase arm-type DNA-binding domain-containing protein [Perlucidibaca piscinae]